MNVANSDAQSPDEATEQYSGSDAYAYAALLILLCCAATCGLAGNGLFNDGQCGWIFWTSLLIAVASAHGLVLHLGKARKAMLDEMLAEARATRSHASSPGQIRLAPPAGSSSHNAQQH